MKSAHLVETTLVNGLLGDPAVYAFFPRTGDALLFDLGNIEALANRELLKVRLALVSHAHIDHFIGFDKLLRVNIPHGRELELIGPPGMIGHVRGKLTGYLWNLLEPKQLRFVVHEIHPDGAVRSARIENQTGFAAETVPSKAPVLTRLDPPLLPAPVATIPVFADGTRIEAVALDHGSPSIAYAVQMPYRFRVKENALKELGLEPGPWIRDLQIALAERALDEPFEVKGKRFTAEDLGARIFLIEHPKPVGYLTDLGFTEGNLARIKLLFANAEKLICEINYRDSEYQKAKERMHLTTRQAALLAAHAGVGELDVFHVSNIYSDDPKAAAAEAATFFEAFKRLNARELAKAVADELAR